MRWRWNWRDVRPRNLVFGAGVVVVAALFVVAILSGSEEPPEDRRAVPTTTTTAADGLVTQVPGPISVVTVPVHTERVVERPTIHIISEDGSTQPVASTTTTSSTSTTSTTTTTTTTSPCFLPPLCL